MEDDLNGEVISLNGESTADDSTPVTPEDRGDVVATETTDQSVELDAPADAAATSRTAGIPKARFDEVNEARKAAQAELERANAELERLRSAPPKPQTAPDEPTQTNPDFDADAKEEAYIEALLEGDTAKAREIRREINANLTNQVANDIENRNNMRAQASSLAEASQQAVSDFPYLDTPDGEFALGLIVAQRNADIAKGVPVHIALTNAVNAIAPKFAPDSQATPTRVLQGDKPAIDTRTQQAIERGAADSLRQPASVQAGIGNRADSVRINVQALDDDQFANLSIADKKRMRGD